MADVLNRIVTRKREEIAARLDGPVRAEPTTRSLIKALRKPGARFIMEIKPRSPSGHVARHDPDAALNAYRPVADAISVLTDGEDFGGSLDLLAAMRRDFGGPILAKDFIVDAAQVSEARSFGADAVLCMLSVLDDADAAAVLAEGERLGMDVLVEVHDEEEMARGLALGAKLIGINNRDLKSLKTDLAVTERLAQGVPADVTLISESGVSGRGDVDRLAPLVDGFLVGSALMAADDIALAARSLVHGPTKICGLTRIEDVALAARVGASHAGFILVPDTPRCVTSDTARTLVMTAREFGMKTVGVFRDSTASHVSEEAAALGFDAVQLHGDEDDAMISQLRDLLPDRVEIWGACGVGNSAQPMRAGTDRSLFDTSRGGQSGGTGDTFDWSALVNRPDRANGFLAGGIGPDNAAEARAQATYGIDICSRVESSPGIKDAQKMEAVFAALRAPSRSISS